jgi:hypothetical protein
MQISVILPILLLKIFFSNTDGTIIQMPSSQRNNILNTDIGCYNCINQLVIDETFAYNASPFKFTSNNVCIKNNNTFEIEEKADYSCAITVLYSHIPVYESITAEEKTVINLKFSAVKNEYCLAAQQQKNADIMCLESSCKKIIMCCNETNYCNTPERFKLTGVVAYSDKKDHNLKNSYSKYTNSKCQLTPKALTETRYQECVLATYNANFNNKTRPTRNLATKIYNIETNFSKIIIILIYSVYINFKNI